MSASLNPHATAAAVLESPMVEIEGLSLWYVAKQALKEINMAVPKHRVTAYIGPSGCGKSTLLRCLNRMNDLVDGVRIAGAIRIGGTDIYDPSVEVTDLRKRVGMVFQKSNPFPKTIFENVAYGPRILGVGHRDDLTGIVERSLRAAALWDEVQDRLSDSALGLSGGQQQRLCIARAIQRRCCWPPERPSAESLRRSWTSSQRAAARRLRSTIPVRSSRCPTPRMRGP